MLFILLAGMPGKAGFSNGRWTAWDTEEQMRKTYWELLEWFQEKFSGSLKHLIIRTPISTVTVLSICPFKALPKISLPSTLANPSRLLIWW